MGESDWKFWAEHVFDGDVYEGSTPAEDLKYIRDEAVFRETDIFVATYPKAGTTWMQEIIWVLKHGPGSADARQQSFDELFPYMEMNVDGKPGLGFVKQLSDPRTIKTHLHAKFFKKQLEGKSPCPRFVVVLRNPKDLLVSLYNFLKMWGGEYEYPGDWTHFFGMVKKDHLFYGNYFEHALSWWAYRDHPRVHILRFEELKKNTRPHIKSTAEFLNIDADDELIDATVTESSFDVMKKRPMENVSQIMVDNMLENSEFFRKGKVGNWKTVFTEEQIKYVDEMAEEKCKPHGLIFE